ncbi:MAG: alcohol dehydrogenase catalytic domain-containing protein [Rhodothermales bacterium]|nr:alcohol dehydrogenase catalytic domain-containing protein [Rhodothermales bacterium]MBO6778085.1 alcohol dehydrogenase catalytic domain-containing protein [Rhodothermales bacterium]
MIQGRAAVTDGQGNWRIDQIQTALPSDGEVLVAIKASGVCHTDWDSRTWGRSMIMGHEGAGVVLEVGPGVERVASGDRVLLNWAIPCETCFQCERGNKSLCEDQKAAHEGSARVGTETVSRSFNLGTMATHSLVHERAVVTIPDQVPFPCAAIMGCGVMTGVGSVLNAAQVEQGASVVVIGCGGVGLNVIQGARLAGAHPIIAIDIRDSRLDMARQFGATHAVRPAPEDRDLVEAASQVAELTGGRGADYAFEATGIPSLGAAPLRMVRNAGMAIQVSGIEEDLTIDMNLFEWDKLYLNPLYGKCDPARDFPLLIDAYTDGSLLLDEMISRTYALDDLGDAFDDMLNGRIAKGVLILS